MPTYSFTFKKQSHPRFISSLIQHHADIYNKFPDAHWTHYLEEDSKGIIHSHGICQSKKRIYVRDIHPGKGWTVDWSITDNESAWLAYISKDKSDQDDIVNKHTQYEQDYISFNSMHDDDVSPRKWKIKRIV